MLSFVNAIKGGDVKICEAEYARLTLGVSIISLMLLFQFTALRVLMKNAKFLSLGVLLQVFCLSLIDIGIFILSPSPYCTALVII